MRQRCLNQNHHAYANYGGRGVAICERWTSFENFLADMGERMSVDMTLDRIDVNGNYEPSNCRWLPRREQTRNQRTTMKLTHNGHTDTLRGWARRLGIDKSSLKTRLDRGWPLDKALSTPPRRC